MIKECIGTNITVHREERTDGDLLERCVIKEDC